MRIIKNLSEVPVTEHYAVLRKTTQTIHHEGDERSRTVPGHGYPAYTETVVSIEYIVFDTEENLSRWITFRDASDTYQVIRAKAVKVNKNVTFSYN